MPDINLDRDISGNDSDLEVMNFHCYSVFYAQSFPLCLLSEEARLNDINLKGLWMDLVLKRNM